MGNPWIAHVKATKKQMAGQPLKTVLKAASKTYKKMKKGGGVASNAGSVSSGSSGSGSVKEGATNPVESELDSSPSGTPDDPSCKKGGGKRRRRKSRKGSKKRRKSRKKSRRSRKGKKRGRKSRKKRKSRRRRR